MANLYEISERYKNIQDLIGNEEITEEILKNAAEDVEDELQEKLLNIAKLCKNIKGNKAMIKEERDRLKNKEFLKFKDPEPNKTEIKKAIKEGKEIKGAVIIENESLVIK